jgi:ribonucleotide reductase alpha subunit
MEQRTFKIYDLIPVPTKICFSNIQITNEVFEKLKSVGLDTQTNTILLEVSHDDLYSFIDFAVEQTINTLMNKK